MKTTLTIAILAVLVFSGPRHCPAFQADHPVSTEQQARELGVKINWKAHNTNDIEVQLEFSPSHEKHARFNQCNLEVVSDGRQLLSAPLVPVQQTSNKVVLDFVIARDFLQKCSLKVIVNEYTCGYVFAMKDFVKLPPTFAFIGVPRAMSTNTFQDIEGLKRRLVVDVQRVTAGSYSGKQVEFPVHADWPSPPKPTVKYSITAGYGQDGHVTILEYHEVK